MATADTMTPETPGMATTHTLYDFSRTQKDKSYEDVQCDPLLVTGIRRAGMSNPVANTADGGMGGAATGAVIGCIATIPIGCVPGCGSRGCASGGAWALPVALHRQRRRPRRSRLTRLLQLTPLLQVTRRLLQFTRLPQRVPLFWGAGNFTRNMAPPASF